MKFSLIAISAILLGVVAAAPLDIIKRGDSDDGGYGEYNNGNSGNNGKGPKNPPKPPKGPPGGYCDSKIKSTCFDYSTPL